MPRWSLRVPCAMSLLLGLMCSPARSAAPDYTRTPVLFVHGHGLSSADWRPLMTYLVGIGYPREYLHAVDIVPNTMDNVRAATTVIAPAATALLDTATVAARNGGSREAPRRLDVVAHSMGALSTRWYAARIRPELVRTWISLAGANHGTDAICGFADDAARELCPAFATSARTHALQVALNGAHGTGVDETPYGIGIDRPDIARIEANPTRSILYLTVRIQSDRWIQPERSAVLDGAGGVAIAVPQGVPAVETSPGNFLFQARIGHDPLLKHPALFRLVAAMLAARDRAAG